MKYGLCPRAIAVLKHQLALYRYLKARGRIEHDQLFFNEGGQPIRHLGYLAKCWSKQHGHSIMTMFRTYAAWMDGAPESDIALILAAIDRDGSSVERLSNNQMQLRLDVPQVAGLGTRLVAEGAGSEAQVTEKTGLKEVAERVGLLAAGDGRSSSASLRTAAAKPRRPKIALRFLSNPVGSSTHPAPPNKKGLKNRPYLFGGEGGIRTHVDVNRNQ